MVSHTSAGNPCANVNEAPARRDGRALPGSFALIPG